jgi:hypothetical protein
MLATVVSSPSPSFFVKDDLAAVRPTLVKACSERMPADRLAPSDDPGQSPFGIGERDLHSLISSAREAIDLLIPTRALTIRSFALHGRTVVLVAAPVLRRGRLPRSADLIRRTLALGTGLELRSWGNMAIVALELPAAHPSQAQSANQENDHEDRQPVAA